MLITEDQLNRVLLKEAKTTKTYYSDANIDIIAMGFEEKINALNPVLVFHGMKYSNFEVVNKTKKPIGFAIVKINTLGIKEIYLEGNGPELPRVTIGPGKRVALSICFEKDKSGISTESLLFAYASTGEQAVSKNLQMVVNITSKQEIINNIFSNCKRNVGAEQLKGAITWWKSWLNHDATKKRFAKTWKYDASTVAKHFQEYNKILSQIKINYVYDEKKNNRGWVSTKSNKGYNIPVTINCRIASEMPANDTESLFIHEIQHILDSYHQFHPYADDIFTFYKDMIVDLTSDTPEVNEEQITNRLKSIGFKDMDIIRIIDDYKYRVAEDTLHLKNKNELMSTLTEVRRVMGLKPDQMITKQLLIQHANNSDVVVFISQWLYSKKGLVDFLGFSNSIAMNKSTTDNRTFA